MPSTIGAHVSHYKARLSQVLLEQYQNAAGRLRSRAAAMPKPGQYVHVYDPSDELDAVGHTFFVSGLAESQASSDEIEFSIDGPLPAEWQPGTELNIRGPLGRGFNLPRSVRKLALASIGSGPGRLLPLAAAAPNAEIALFCDAPVGELPFSIEQQGLENLPEALVWADYLAIDISIQDLDDLATYLKLKPPLPKKFLAQVLVRTQMPCGGVAQCGVCTLSTNRGNKLACADGPVFDLRDLV